MIKHTLQQGSDEWHAFRLEHFGASEAAAMLGLSSYTTRVDLLHHKHTGQSKEVGGALQAIFDRGHEVEAMARPIVEELIGEDLYPVTCSEGRLSASCDGLTMGMDDGETVFEHKQWNEKLAEAVRNQELPEEHMPQCQQVMLVTGAARLIFVVSDGTKQNMVYMTVLPDAEYQARIVAGWAQFEKDLAAYEPQPVFEKPAAEAVMALPALVVQVRGEVTTSNMLEFAAATETYLANIKTELVTDQDFANAKAAASNCRDTVKKLELTKESMLAQTVTIGEAVRMIDKWKEDYRLMALGLEKDVERETEARRVAIIREHKDKFTAHVAGLQEEIVGVVLTVQHPDFVAALKGKKSIKGWQDAANAALSNAIIEADAVAKDIRGKLAWCKETAKGYGFLFNDLQQIIFKPMDDFQLVVTTRIDAHKKAEADKLEAERQRIHIEEEIKARAKVEAEAKEQQEAAAVEERRKQAQIDSQKRSSGHTQAVSEIKAHEAEHGEPQERGSGDPPTSINSAYASPARQQLIEAVAEAFGASMADAEHWLVEEFGRVTA